MLDEVREVSPAHGRGDNEGTGTRQGGVDHTTLREQFAGTLVAPWDEEYAEARRIWNGANDPRPAPIARCADAADVIEAVRWARERDLDFGLHSPVDARPVRGQQPKQKFGSTAQQRENSWQANNGAFTARSLIPVIVR